jgi:hypothetical protein
MTKANKWMAVGRAVDLEPPLLPGEQREYFVEEIDPIPSDLYRLRNSSKRVILEGITLDELDRYWDARIAADGQPINKVFHICLSTADPGGNDEVPSGGAPGLRREL